MLGFDSFVGNHEVYGGEAFTKEEAEEAARALVRLPGVVAVELYGSVARDGKGNDIDLLLIVEDEALYQRFVTLVKDEVEDLHQRKIPTIDGATVRRDAAEKVFREFDSEASVIVFMKAMPLYWELVLDVFIMPNNWRDRIDEIQGNLPHHDPNFVRNIAKDARVITTRQP